MKSQHKESNLPKQQQKETACPKYEFTGETLEWNRRTLHRIRSTTEDLKGGWLEKESNLSHEGNCWVADNAKVFGDAVVKEHALISHSAEVFGFAVVSGNGIVCDSAQVFSSAYVHQDAYIAGNMKISGCAVVGDRIHLKGQFHVKDPIAKVSMPLDDIYVVGDYLMVNRMVDWKQSWVDNFMESNKDNPKYSERMLLLYLKTFKRLAGE